MLGVGWLALFVLHLWSTRGITGPSVVFDEAGYLGSARWLAGGARWDMPVSPSYAVGYPVLLAPIMALFDTAAAQWQAVLVLNAALLASVLPGLAFVLRRVIGASRSNALLGAAVGALAPCVLAAGVSAIAENLVLPLVPATVAAAWALTRSGQPRWTAAQYAFGPLMALLTVTHARFTLGFLVALGALAVGVRMGAVARSTALVNGGFMVGVLSAGTVLDRVVRGARWDEVEKLEGGPRDWVHLLRSFDGLWELSLSAIGQAWYLAAGSLGLSVVGLWFLATKVFTPSGTDDPTRDRRFVIGVLLAVAAAVFATSVAFFAQNQFRADHWVYGRHNDSFTPLWIGAAVVVLLGADTLRLKLNHLLVAMVVVGVTGAVVITSRDPMDLGGQFSVFAVPAISRFPSTEQGSVFVRATATALVGCAVVMVVVAASRWWAGRTPARRSLTPVRLVLPALLAVSFTYAGFGTVNGTRSYRNFLTEGWEVPHELERLGIEELQIEARTARSVPTLLYPFALPGVHVSVYDAQRGEPTAPYVVARLDDPFRPAAGDRVVLLDSNWLYALWDAPVGLAVWVRPGPEQDRLAAQGLLLPDGFPTDLPAEARSVDLRLTGGVEPGGTLRLAPGGATTVAVAGSHTGSGSPWPDHASTGQLPVQVIAHVEPDDPSLPDGIGSGGKLDRWVRPGDDFTSTVDIRAIGPLFADLVPGRYEVTLGIGQTVDQEDHWFVPGSDTTFTLEVG